MNLPETAAEESQRRGIPKIAVSLMLMIVVCLALVAVFANLERLQRDDVEAVVVRPAASPTPQATEP
jgi:cell division septal protein FtsQ